MESSQSGHTHVTAAQTRAENINGGPGVQATPQGPPSLSPQITLSLRPEPPPRASLCWFGQYPAIPLPWTTSCQGKRWERGEASTSQPARHPTPQAPRRAHSFGLCLVIPGWPSLGCGTRCQVTTACCRCQVICTSLPSAFKGCTIGHSPPRVSHTKVAWTPPAVTFHEGGLGLWEPWQS